MAQYQVHLRALHGSASVGNEITSSVDTEPLRTVHCVLSQNMSVGTWPGSPHRTVAWRREAGTSQNYPHIAHKSHPTCQGSLHFYYVSLPLCLTDIQSCPPLKHGMAIGQGAWGEGLVSDGRFDTVTHQTRGTLMHHGSRTCT